MFHSIASWFKKVFNKLPSWTQTASAALTVAGAMISKIVGLIAGTESETLSASVIAEVQADLVTLKHLVADAHGTNDAAGIENAIGSLTAHLDELLAAGHIKDPATLAKVKDTIGIILAALQGVLALLPKSA